MELDEKIRKAYFAAKGRNGSPRLAKDLQVNGTQVSRLTVSLHMKRMGIHSKFPHRFKVTTDSSHDYKVAPNLLNRVFRCDEPSKACVSDLTYIPCTDGFLYLTMVLDLFDRKPIGWSMSENMKASDTVIPAIRMADRNRPFAEGMIFHSDRGVQYACGQTVNVLKSLKVKQSMSRKGNCLDNAVMENFFGLLKSELLYLQEFESMEHFKAELVEYLDYYNNRRIKVKLKGLPPAIHRQQALSAA